VTLFPTVPWAGSVGPATEGIALASLLPISGRTDDDSKVRSPGHGARVRIM
jgi:hypothetical protein